MKNIIIPVDFSKQSEFALKAGAILAKKHDAVLHVLHMLELSDSIFTHSVTDNKNEMRFMLALAKKKIGKILPCNVIVQELENGKTNVIAVNLVASMQAVEDDDLPPSPKKLPKN